MSYRSPVLDRPGAVADDGIDAGVALHYGNPVAEQRRLLADDGWVDLSHRDVIRISGADRLRYLHAMTTQDFESLEPGVRTDALVLSPQGHIEHAFTGIDDGSVFVAHTEPGAAEGLAAFLLQMRFDLRVEIEAAADLAVVQHGVGDVHTISRPDLADHAHGEPVGTWAAEALRIERGWPRVGPDSDHRSIPNELGLVGTALDKGCYRGQETVARVHTLGRPPRRLTRLLLDGSAERLPTRGADVTAAGRTVGVVGTSARHHELGPIALALVKRNVDIDETLEVDGIAAGQEVVVDPGVGLHVRPNLRG